MNVWTGGELADCPFASSRAWSTIGLGAPTGTVAVNVSGGDTSTLLDVAAGNVVGPLPVTVLLLKVSEPGMVPAATVHVHWYTTGSASFEVVVSALVSVGPVRVLHDAPFVGVVTRVPAVTPVTGVLEWTASVTVTASPVTTSDREVVNDVKNPLGARPGTKTRAPPWLVARMNGASGLHVLAAMS